MGQTYNVSKYISARHLFCIYDFQGKMQEELQDSSVCSNARVGNQDVTEKRGQNTIVRIEQRNGRFPRKKTFLFQMK